MFIFSPLAFVMVAGEVASLDWPGVGWPPAALVVELAVVLAAALVAPDVAGLVVAPGVTGAEVAGGLAGAVVRATLAGATLAEAGAVVATGPAAVLASGVEVGGLSPQATSKAAAIINPKKRAGLGPDRDTLRGEFLTDLLKEEGMISSFVGVLWLALAGATFRKRRFGIKATRPVD